MSEVIPAGWHLQPMADIVSVEYGKSPKKVVTDNGPYPVIGTGGVTGYASAYLHPGNTTVIGRKGTINKPSFLSEKFWAIDTTYYVTQYKSTDPKWFYYALSSLDLSAFNEASGVPSLNRETLYAIPFLSPPLTEQKKIATILSSIDDTIEKTRAQIDKLKDLKTGMMQELLTQGIGHTEFKDSPVGKIPASWELRAIGNLLEFKNGLNKEKEAFGRGSPIINFNDVFHNYGIYLSGLAGKVMLTQSEKKRFSVQKGDVFFTRTSENPDEIGMSAVLLEDIDDASFSGFVLRGRQITDELELFFCKYCFSADYVRSQIVSSCSYTTRALTNGALLSECFIAVPPKAEQVFIASVLDSIINKIHRLGVSFNAVTALKKALMQDLLTGKVRVKVDSPETVAA